MYDFTVTATIPTTFVLGYRLKFIGAYYQILVTTMYTRQHVPHLGQLEKV